MDELIDELLRRLAALEKTTFRMGKITATSPLSVTLGGNDTAYTGVKKLASATLSTNDIVFVVTLGNDLIVLGKIA